tara:strand:- start:735 stop:1115 length:381 start_codon:yes stop_codon:yes gene_type:complete
MKKALKDKIRAATVGKRKTFKCEIVSFDGVDIEVRQLSLAARRDYMTASLDRVTDSNGKETQQANLLKLQVYAVIASSYVPGEEALVFEETDFNSIKDSVTGGYADAIWEAVQRLSNITTEEAKKN